MIFGPTGSGKSHLAVRLAGVFGGQVVSCDSIQVHRSLDIGSAKLPISERGGIPHYLLDVVGPEADLTAGSYSRLARAALREIRNQNAIPLVAGGTGFYLRALLEGLSPAPPNDQKLRARLHAMAARRPAAPYRFLRQHDPLAASRIHPNDIQKLIRAIELTVRGGRPASAIQSTRRDALTGYRVLKLGLHPERSLLYAGLDQRVRLMFENGLLEETRSLLAAGVDPHAKAMQSLGYKQAVQVLAGELALPDAILQCQTKTRQYAKRQMTWFRAEKGAIWLPGFGNNPEIAKHAIELTGRFLTSQSIC